MPRVNVKDQRKHQLIEANLACIARQGLEGTTITHVAGEADMARGIINFYFTTKERMMEETLAFLAEEYTRAWQEAQAKAATPLEALKAVAASGFLGTGVRQRLLAWMAFSGQAATHPNYRKIIAKAAKDKRDHMEQLWREILNHSGKEDQAAVLARSLQAMVRGLRMAFVLDGETADSKQIAAACSHFVDAQIAVLVRDEEIDALMAVMEDDKAQQDVDAASSGRPQIVLREEDARRMRERAQEEKILRGQQEAAEALGQRSLFGKPEYPSQLSFDDLFAA